MPSDTVFHSAYSIQGESASFDCRKSMIRKHMKILQFSVNDGGQLCLNILQDCVTFGSTGNRYRLAGFWDFLIFHKSFLQTLEYQLFLPLRRLLSIFVA